MIDDILKRALAGDKNAENDLFTKVAKNFQMIAEYRIKDIELARDVAAEACRIVLEKYRTETFSVDFYAWAYGIINLHIKSRLSKEMQKKARIATPDELNTLANKAVLSSDEIIQLKRCYLELIKKHNRYARILNFAHQGYTQQEICKNIGVTRTNYYTILSRARSLLWNCIQNGGHE